MKGVSAWVWKVGRVILAAVLLVAVFRYVVKLDDTVHLVDGTQVGGRIVESEDGAHVTLAGHPAPYPLQDVATRPGSDLVRLEDRTEIRGTITSIDDQYLSIEVGKKTFTYSRAGVTVTRGEPWVDLGLVTLLKRMSPREYFYGFLLLGIPPVIGGLRWRMLLVAQGIQTSRYRALELTMIGLFFNNFMPGLTGGDVVKAYYAAKLTSDKKTHAVVTVFLDRVVGMVALGIVAGAAVLLGLAVSGAVSDSMYQEASWFVLGFMMLSIAGGMAFYSRRLRKVIGSAVRGMPGYGRVRRIGAIARASGMVRRVDSALFLYRCRKMVLLNTVAISLLAHASAVVAIYFFGRALGVTQAGVLHYFVVVPVCFIISSLGVTPSGWGVGEVIFRILFGAVGVPGTAAVTMSVIYRLTQALWTLPGGLFFMLQRDKIHVAEAQAEVGEGLVEGQNAGQGD